MHSRLLPGSVSSKESGRPSMKQSATNIRFYADEIKGLRVLRP